MIIPSVDQKSYMANTQSCKYNAYYFGEDTNTDILNSAGEVHEKYRNILNEFFDCK